jgi:pre-mRNA-splicing helicase BRR2
VATAGGAGEDRDQEAEELPEEEAVIMGSVPGGSATSKEKDKDFIPAREIDAYWLQRQIGSIYSDAHIRQSKTQEALRILSGASEEEGGEEKPLREIENELADLFDYEHHEVVHRQDRVAYKISSSRGRRSQRSCGTRDCI